VWHNGTISTLNGVLLVQSAENEKHEEKFKTNDNSE